MKALFSCILISLTLIASGQQGIVSVGGDATGSGGSVSYSVGQVAYSNNNFVNEGVQQPYEIFILSVDDSFLDVQLNVFPNPTLNELIIAMKDFHGGIIAEVRASDGILLDSIQLVSEQTRINTHSWTAAIYFIHLFDSAGRSATFQIVKH
jgi:hypothetical protein